MAKEATDQEDVFEDTEYVVGEDENVTAVDAEIEVEVEDDTPASDQGREPLPKKITDSLDNEEVEDYSAKVKQRIDQMKKAWHDERRAKETASRERDEATTFTKQLMQERDAPRQRLSTGETWALTETKRRAELEVAEAKRAYRDAYEEGDAEKIADAQAQLSSATVDQQRVQQIQPQFTLQPEQKPVYNQPQAETPVSAPEPDTRTREWGDENEWFGADDEMTSFALGVHQKLVKEGVPPSTNHYYERIDARMRDVFPGKFEDAPKKGKRQPSTVVAPAGRTPKGKKVVLTKSQVSIAKRLGVSPEDYAKEVIKQQMGA
ncbi:MAG: hypothetical protein KAG66_23005 [Methylococcales bacterium]|nr:hypothetical protein [Methylococcales bacterium]